MTPHPPPCSGTPYTEAEAKGLIQQLLVAVDWCNQKVRIAPL